MKILFLPPLCLLLIQCTPNDESPTGTNDSQSAFMNHIRAYCGGAFHGKTQFITLGDGDHPLQDPELVMIFKECRDDVIRIAFHVDDDQSRTWVLSKHGHGLHLAHDHRNPDGSEQDDNMYGGWANDDGNDTIRFFPADPETIENRPARAANRWSMEINPQSDEFIYSLFLNDELAYRAVFDLSSQARRRNNPH